VSEAICPGLRIEGGRRPRSAVLRAVEFPAENSQIGMNGPRNEWSQTDRGDLNVPLPLECQLAARPLVACDCRMKGRVATASDARQADGGEALIGAEAAAVARAAPWSAPAVGFESKLASPRLRPGRGQRSVRR
jgi:hypothetical protein